MKLGSEGYSPAMRRKMYAASRRAVIGDGGNWVEPLGQMHFAGWEQILD